MKRITGLEGGVGGEVAGGVLLGGAEDAGAPLLVAALGRRPGRARRRSHLPWRGLEETLGGWIPAWFVGVVAGSGLVKTRGVRWWLGCAGGGLAVAGRRDTIAAKPLAKSGTPSIPK